VTLYGLADIWLGSVKSTGSTAGVSFSNRDTLSESGGVNTSRFGLKGSEDLGGGLKANFQLEQGFNLDTGAQQAAGSAFSRQSWVGLSGGFGEVQLGKVWTSYDDIRSSANDTFNANIASSFSTWLGYTDRTNNSIKYITPTMSGFSGSFTYSLGENKTPANSASDIMSLGVQYGAGPLFVGFAHQSEKQNSPVTQAKTTYNLINGSYDLGVVKLVAGYNQVKDSVVGVPQDGKAKEFNLGVEAPLAANLNLGVGYAQSDVEFGGVDVSESKGYSAALLYSLSKRTTAYAAITQTKTDISNSSDFSKTQLYAVGINHKF